MDSWFTFYQSDHWTTKTRNQPQVSVQMDYIFILTSKLPQIPYHSRLAGHQTNASVLFSI